MSDRERWILYPLLTFALSMCVKTQADLWKIQEAVVIERPRGESGQPWVRVACNEFVLQSPAGRPQVQLRDTENGGLVLINNAQGGPAALLGVDRQSGTLETFDATGRKLVMLTAADGGGAVLAVRPDDRKAMLLGHHQQMRASGLFEVQFHEQNTWVVPRVGWVEVAGKKIGPPTSPAPVNPPAPTPPAPPPPVPGDKKE